MTSAIERTFFIALTAMICVIYGIVSAKIKIFPYPLVNAALIALNEVNRGVGLMFSKVHPHIIEGPGSPNDSVYLDKSAVSPGLTAMSLYRDGGFGVVMVDMNGSVVHAWRMPEAIYQAAANHNWDLDPDEYEIMGFELTPEGDLLFIMSFRLMAKLDRCSNVKWILPKRAHHDLARADDDTYWVLSQRFVDEEMENRRGFSIPYIEDTVLNVSDQGVVLREFSLIDAFLNSNYSGVILQGHEDFPAVVNMDPLHTNDIDVITSDFANHHAFADEGDLMVSLRTVDAIAIIDKDDKRVKWALSGMFLRQHDPDILPSGEMLVFDNRTDVGQHNGARYRLDPQRFGYSRVIRFDPETQDVRWEFTGSAGRPFYTSIQGDQQMLSNGNVLIVETEAGRVFEVEPRTNGIVWSFHNLVAHRNEMRRARITGATRYPQSFAAFAGQPCD